jgi:peptide/nickel transport system permease protein
VLQHLIKRFLVTIPVLIFVSILIFGAVRVIPGDVCRVVLLGSPEVTDEECAEVNAKLGVDKPVVTQYIHWAGNVHQGDFGNSIISQRQVMEEISGRLSVTVELALLACAISLLMAVPIGVISAYYQDRFPDHFLRLVTIGWLSMPGFWVGTMLITFPAKWWGYAPPLVYADIWEEPLKNLEQLITPSIALGLALSGSLARLTRSSMLEVMRENYIWTARAKGLRERTIFIRHALKNALLPVITLFGLQVGVVMGGAVVVESIFSLPGLGTLLVNAVTFKDYPQIQGIVLFFAMLIIFINFLVDLSYTLIDPRVRFT